jgi:hypothetical protein
MIYLSSTVRLDDEPYRMTVRSRYLIPSLRLSVLTFRLSEELCWLGIQGSGELGDDFQAHMVFSGLNLREVAPTHPCGIGKFVLGQTSVMPEAPQIRRK